MLFASMFSPSPFFQHLDSGIGVLTLQAPPSLPYQKTLDVALVDFTSSYTSLMVQVLNNGVIYGNCFEILMYFHYQILLILKSCIGYNNLSWTTMMISDLVSWIITSSSISKSSSNLDVSHDLKYLGCIAYALTLIKSRTKLDPRLKRIFLWYKYGTKCYLLFYLHNFFF